MDCDDEKIREIADEVKDGEKTTALSEYIAEFKDSLVESFVEENRELYDEFLRQFGEDTHGTAIKVGFAEYHYELFNRFCRDIYEDIVADRQTKRSMMR